MGRCIRGSTVTGRAAFRVLILAAGIALTAIRAWPQEALKVVTDNVSREYREKPKRMRLFCRPAEECVEGKKQTGATTRYDSRRG